MSSPFLGEIRMFAGNFAPRSWALCEGQLLNISQNDALFSLFGTTYGGDGRTTFGLPDLRGRVPIHKGTGPGLSPRTIGGRSGSEQVTLAATHLPVHRHTWQATQTAASESQPGGNVTAGNLSVDAYRGAVGAPMAMASAAIENAGMPAPSAHANVQPYLVINYIVALSGVFPSSP